MTPHHHLVSSIPLQMFQVASKEGGTILGGQPSEFKVYQGQAHAQGRTPGEDVRVNAQGRSASADIRPMLDPKVHHLTC